MIRGDFRIDDYSQNPSKNGQHKYSPEDVHVSIQKKNLLFILFYDKNL